LGVALGFVLLVVALVIWGQLAFRSTRQAETRAQSRSRIGAFIVMFAAGMASFPNSKWVERDEEETF
jgi:hypothetical protein